MPDIKQRAHKMFDDTYQPFENSGKADVMSVQFVNGECANSNIKSFIDEIIDIAVEEEKRKMIEWAESKKNKLVMKWDNDKACSQVYDSVIYGWDDCPTKPKLSAEALNIK